MIDNKLKFSIFKQNSLQIFKILKLYNHIRNRQMCLRLMFKCIIMLQYDIIYKNVVS